MENKFAGFWHLMTVMMTMMMMLILQHIIPLLSTKTVFFLSTLRSQSCHDEEDEDGEEVKSFEVGDQSVCLSVCPHDGLGYKVLCRCLSCFT